MILKLTRQEDRRQLFPRLDGRRAKLLPLLRELVDLARGGSFLQERLGNSGQSVTGTAVFSRPTWCPCETRRKMISSSTSKQCKKKESQTVKRYGSEVRGPTLPLRGSGQMAQTGAGRNGMNGMMAQNPTIFCWRVNLELYIDHWIEDRTTTWNDEQCNFNQPFICEKNKN